MPDTKDLKALKLPSWEKGTKVEDFDNLLTAAAATRGQALEVINGVFLEKMKNSKRTERPVTLTGDEEAEIMEENRRFFNDFLVAIGNRRLMSTIRNSTNSYFPKGCGRTA